MKDIVRNIVKMLLQITKESEVSDLNEQLNKPYSQFYFDISRNDRGMGLTTFHVFINDVISQLSYDIKCLENKEGKNYGKFAFEIATYMIDNNLVCLDKKSFSDNKGQVRILSKEKEEV